MSRNILLFYMSVYRPEVLSGEKYTRAQTNETALRYFVQNKESCPDRILALCSESVRSKKTVPALQKGKERTTLEYFAEDALPRLGLPEECLKMIPVPDVMTEKAQAQAIAKIVTEIEPEDSLYIEFSGGPRDIAMLLVSVARYLQDLLRVETRGLVYAELQGSQPVLRDSSQLYRFYDLISAIDEFFSTGSAKKLQNYLNVNNEKEPAVRGLMQAVTKFSDDLALCLVGELKNDLKKIALALQQHPAAREDLNGLLFQLLNDRFAQEFSALNQNKKDPLPQLTIWCARHDLYQQALTLLTEQMPKFICSRIWLRPTAAARDYLSSPQNNQGNNQDKPWYVPLFHYHFCRLIHMQETVGKPRSSLYIRGGNGAVRYAQLSEIENYLQQAAERGLLEYDPKDIELLAQLIQCYQKAVQCRNQINHANQKGEYFTPDKIVPLEPRALHELLQQTAELLEEIQGRTIER